MKRTLEEYWKKVKELTDYLKSAPDRSSEDCNQKHDELMKLMNELTTDLKENREKNNV